MFNDNIFLFISTTILVCLYWSVPSTWPVARRWLVVIGSLVIVFAKSPHSALLVGGVSLLCAGWSPILARRNGDRWLVPALASALLPLAWWRSYGGGGGMALGIAFAMLRVVTLLADSAWRRERFALSQILCLNFFFPAFAAGPIERAAAFANSPFTATFSTLTFLNGLVRIILGLFKIDYVGDLVGALISGGAPGGEFDPSYGPGAWLLVILKFLKIYFEFSGYTDVAIGLASLFHLNLRENFRYPFLATSLQDFWRRWHKSLAEVVLNYIYLPIVRRTGRLGVAILSAFSIIGLWHEFRLPYLLWGLGHAGGLSIERWVGMRTAEWSRAGPLRLARFAAWGLTMAYIMVLSAVAGSPDLDAVGRLLAGLVRWR